MKTYFITGAAGFIGSSLAERLLKEGYKVIGIDNFCDFYNPTIKENNVKELMNNENFKLYRKDIVKRKINNNRDVMFYGNRIVDRKTGKTIEEQEFYNPICSVYGDVVIDYDAEGSVNGQMDLSDLSADYGLFDTGNRPLKTTGCSRTGCVLCGFGCHLEKPGEGRFERLKETHPGMYKLLDVIENNGVTYREAIDWINEHGNMNIRY